MDGGGCQRVEFLLRPHRRWPSLEADAAALHLELQLERAALATRSQSAAGRRRCQVCGAWAESPASLGAHLAAVHVCSCRVCGLVLPSEHLLQLHESEAHDATFSLLASGRAQVSLLLLNCAAWAVWAVRARWRGGGTSWGNAGSGPRPRCLPAQASALSLDAPAPQLRCLVPDCRAAFRSSRERAVHLQAHHAFGGGAAAALTRLLASRAAAGAARTDGHRMGATAGATEDGCGASSSARAAASADAVAPAAAAAAVASAEPSATVAGLIVGPGMAGAAVPPPSLRQWSADGWGDVPAAPALAAGSCVAATPARRGTPPAMGPGESDARRRRLRMVPRAVQLRRAAPSSSASSARSSAPSSSASSARSSAPAAAAAVARLH